MDDKHHPNIVKVRHRRTRAFICTLSLYFLQKAYIYVSMKKVLNESSAI